MEERNYTTMTQEELNKEFRERISRLDDEGFQLIKKSLEQLILIQNGDFPEAKAIQDEFAARCLTESISWEEFSAHVAKMDTLLGIS